ncbi:carboxypeptidase regulatory-like domain-containing protein [Anaerococcus sp. Marseille-P9784]|uniref:carboxypeptidase regulatory-like domain-containing protein n=1 Tax=Anaerococcus sp. Marseille-P9784 TaxID=2614127 RepID=UPI00124A134E|nr:carboxypeptidase regulatory-like domain-containing protein [Anaerococcus sp. Marseille-P9784]
MKTKKLLAVALAAGMLIGGGTKALDLAIPTAYATEEKSLEQLETDLEAAKKEQEDLQNKKTASESKLKDIKRQLRSKRISNEEREKLKKQEEEETDNIAKYTEGLKKVENQITELEKKIEEAKRAPVQEFTIEVTTTKPDGSVAQSTVTGKDVNEAKQNVTNAAEKIDGYKINIKFSADNKTATVTYEKEDEQVNTWDVNVSLQINSLTGKPWQDVPGATITLTNNDTGAVVHTYTTTTDNDGYAHANVPEGNYTLTVTNLPTGGVLAGKTYRWQGPSSVSKKIKGPTSQPFWLEELFTLVSRYVDTEGNVIAPEETAQFNRTQLYRGEANPNPKDIEGYKYKEFTSEGGPSQGRGTFTYVYEALIYTRFVDPSGNDIAPKEYGIKEFKIIKGYKWIKTEKDEKGNVTHIYLPEYPDDDSTTTTTEETNKDNETKPEDTKPEDKPEDGKDNSDENKAKDLIDKLNKNTAEIEKILKENEANQDKEPDKKPDEKPDKKPEKKPEKDNKGKKSNPKTGVAGISLVAGSLALASAALVATKKKNK